MKDVDIKVGVADENFTATQAALQNSIISQYLLFYIDDYTKFIHDLKDNFVIDCSQEYKLKLALENSGKYATVEKLHATQTIGCLQTNITKRNSDHCVKKFIDVLKSQTELRPLAYFLLEWIVKCKITKKQMDSGNTYSKYIWFNNSYFDNGMFSRLKNR